MEILPKASNQQAQRSWYAETYDGLISKGSAAVDGSRSPDGFVRARGSLLLRTIRRAAVISFVALVPAAGLFYHDQRAAPPPPQVAQITPLDALWIDARPEAEYTREHVPGALNLNEGNWDKALARVFEIWQPSRPIVVYCAAGCSSATEIAARLTGLGIEPVTVFTGGFSQWKQNKDSQGK